MLGMERGEYFFRSFRNVNARHFSISRHAMRNDS
jgi:hypothetical protein